MIQILSAEDAILRSCGSPFKFFINLGIYFLSSPYSPDTALLSVLPDLETILKARLESHENDVHRDNEDYSPSCYSDFMATLSALTAVIQGQNVEENFWALQSKLDLNIRSQNP